MNFLASLRPVGLLISFLGCSSACCDTSPCAAQGTLRSQPQASMSLLSSRPTSWIAVSSCWRGLQRFAKVCTDAIVLARSSGLASGSAGSGTQPGWRAAPERTPAPALGLLLCTVVCEKQLMVLVESDVCEPGEGGTWCCIPSVL